MDQVKWKELQTIMDKRKDDGTDDSVDIGCIGCLLQLLKVIWWIITLPFRIIGFLLEALGVMLV